MAGPTFNATNASGNNFGSLASWTPVSITGVLANDTILVFVINYTNANPTLAPTSVTDGQGSYTQVAVATAAFNPNMTVWALTGATSGTHTVTITWASAVAGNVLWSTWSNSTGSFVDQGGGTWYNATGLVLSQTLVNAYSNDTVVSAWNSGGVAATSETGSLWFNGGGIGVGVQGQSQVQSGSGSINPSATYTANQYGGFVAVSLQNTASASLMGQACL